MYTIDPILYDKIVRFCAYQDRAISEVNRKMDALGIVASMHVEYMEILQEEGMQDELRYAESFVQGKLRIKGWGLRKVEQHLKHKGVDTQVIQQALEGRQDDDYMERLKHIAESKLEQAKGKDEYERKSKVFRYLQQRGYETSLIHRALFES
jgi:regulatory protein